jgi:hypothetical protein
VLAYQLSADRQVPLYALACANSILIAHDEVAFESFPVAFCPNLAAIVSAASSPLRRSASGKIKNYVADIVQHP